MTTKVLKKALGEAGALIDDSSGKDNLLDVLTAMANGLAERLTGEQSVIATAVLSCVLADRALEMDASIQSSIGTTGTLGETTIVLKVAGVTVATVTTDNTEDDGTLKSDTGTASVSVAVGDLIELEVTAAPTSGVDLVATARLRPVTVE